MWSQMYFFECASVVATQQLYEQTHPGHVPLPFADVIGGLLGEHPLLEHVVERMDGAQLQTLLLVKHVSFAHTKALCTHEHRRGAPLTDTHEHSQRTVYSRVKRTITQ